MHDTTNREAGSFQEGPTAISYILRKSVQLVPPTLARRKLDEGNHEKFLSQTGIVPAVF